MMEGSLARKLRVLRAERGLSREAAARLIGVAPETLSDLERGKRRAYAPTLGKIAKGYGVSTEALVEEPVPLAEAPSGSGLPDEAPHLALVVEDVRRRLREAESMGDYKRAFSEIVFLYFGARSVYVAEDGSGLKPELRAGLESKGPEHVEQFAEAFQWVHINYHALGEQFRLQYGPVEDIPAGVVDELDQLRRRKAG